MYTDILVNDLLMVIWGYLRPLCLEAAGPLASFLQAHKHTPIASSSQTMRYYTHYSVDDVRCYLTKTIFVLLKEEDRHAYQVNFACSWAKLGLIG